jgi:hypothetical protein
MEVIDGNKVAAEIIAELKAEVAAGTGRPPCLALVRVGDDPASVSYVRKKGQTAAEIGIESRNLLPPVTIEPGGAGGPGRQPELPIPASTASWSSPRSPPTWTSRRSSGGSRRRRTSTASTR